MSRFLNDLNARETTRGKQRVLILNEPLKYESEHLGRVVEIPAGFPSDGASVPRPLWFMYHPFGRYLRAAVVHDWFCFTQSIDYKDAAIVFKEAMEVCGVNRWRRQKMYWAVKFFGPKF